MAYVYSIEEDMKETFLHDQASQTKASEDVKKNSRLNLSIKLLCLLVAICSASLLLKRGPVVPLSTIKEISPDATDECCTIHGNECRSGLCNIKLFCKIICEGDWMVPTHVSYHQCLTYAEYELT